MKKNLLILLLSFLLLSTYGHEITIVSNNRPYADIVVLEKSNKQLNEVATNFRDYIFKSTKAKLNIVNTVNPSHNNVIIATQYKGINYDYNALDEDGFLIRSSGNIIIISGKTDWGTVFGVYEFLEKFIGIRWLMPTELWTEIPTKSNITLNKIDILENPKFLSRSFFSINMENKDLLLNIWGKYNKLRNRVEFHHNLINIFNPEIIVKNNPQFLPNINGEKYIPKNKFDENWQPNFQAKGIDAYAAKEIIKYFRNNPQKTSISLGINDSENFDKTNYSGRLNYIGRENYSNAYYSWVNRTVRIVNRTIPNKKFGLLAYGRVAETPSFQLEKNIIPFITYERLMWKDPVLMKKDWKITNEWKQKSMELGWYDYVYGSIYVLPRIYLNLYQDYMIAANKLNVKYYVAEYYPNWIEGPKGWIMTKLLWNPYQDLDSLLNDWFNNAVGPKSAIFLKGFYSLWESFWTEDIPSSKWWQNNSTYLTFSDKSYVNEISLEKILIADELLNNAYKNAYSEKYKKRIEDLLIMWALCKMNYLYFQTNKSKQLDDNVYRRLIKLSYIDKKIIESKIAELEKHPLYQPIMYIYKKIY